MAKRRKSPPPHQQASSKKEQTLDSLFSSLGRIEIVLLVGGVLLLMVLMYTIETILSPFLALGALLFLLYPLRKYLLARNLMWLGAILFSLWFLYSLRQILAPFVVSLVLAYVLSPLVDLFERWRIPRWATALVLIVLFLTGITLGIFFILPVAISQFEGVLENVSRVVSDFRTTLWNSRWMFLLEQYGVSADELRATISSQLTPRVEDILKGVLRAILAVVTSVSAIVTQVVYVIMVPFLTFYILTDFPKISHRFRMLFPRRVRDQVGVYMQQADALIGHYLRGALTVALLQGIAVSVSFSLFGIKYALLLGLLAVFFDLIPYFGLLALMGLSVLVAGFSDPPVVEKMVFALLSIGVFHLLEVSFLSPKIVGTKVGLHPLLIILSLLIFMYFLGFVGLLIAVPTTALVILFVREWERRRHGTTPLESESAIPF